MYLNTKTKDTAKDFDIFGNKNTKIEGTSFLDNGGKSSNNENKLPELNIYQITKLGDDNSPKTVSQAEERTSTNEQYAKGGNIKLQTVPIKNNNNNINILIEASNLLKNSKKSSNDVNSENHLPIDLSIIPHIDHVEVSTTQSVGINASSNEERLSKVLSDLESLTEAIIIDLQTNLYANAQVSKDKIMRTTNLPYQQSFEAI